MNFKDAVINELILCGIYTAEHETNPTKALHDAINWNVAVALDPKVSKEAMDMLTAERERCAKVCDLIATEIDNTNNLATYIGKAIRTLGES